MGCRVPVPVVTHGLWREQKTAALRAMVMHELKIGISMVINSPVFPSPIKIQVIPLDAFAVRSCFETGKGYKPLPGSGAGRTPPVYRFCPMTVLQTAARQNPDTAADHKAPVNRLFILMKGCRNPPGRFPMDLDPLQALFFSFWINSGPGPVVAGTGGNIAKRQKVTDGQTI